jgi:hypothetical protein
LHWQLVAAGLSLGDCALAGHAEQFALPTVSLKVSAAHPTHASPSRPEKPTLHRHAVAAALAGGFTLAATRRASSAGVTKSTAPGASASVSCATARASDTLCDHACTTMSE